MRREIPDENTRVPGAKREDDQMVLVTFTIMISIIKHIS